MSLLIYTSRTTPFREELKHHFPQVYIVGKPTEAIRELETLLRTNPPQTIIGIFHSWNKHAYIEPTAINQFNRTKHLVPGGPAQLPLTVPASHPGFIRNPHTHDAFCNWMMYHVAHLICQHQLPCRHLFFHCNQPDLPRIAKLAQTARLTQP